jgi:hypothetical protein
MFPLVDGTAILVIWDAPSAQVMLMIATQQGVVYSDQNWLVGRIPTSLAITACTQDLWVAVNGTTIAMHHFQLAAPVGECATGSLYVPRASR